MSKSLTEQLFDEVPKARNEIYKAGDPTPLERVQLNGEEFELYLKREDLGPINAYKWRGGYNAVLNHHRATGCKTIVAASAGNHAQGVALAARMLNLQAKIFMPLAAPLMKQKAVQRHGGDHVELILEGDTYNQAGDAAKKYVAETGDTYIHPFDDLYTMAGQAMIADEIIKDAATQDIGAFDYAFLQIGGGGMAGAVSAWLKQHWPKIHIIGVEGEDQASMKASVEAGKPVTLDKVDTFCDGTAVTRPGDLTFEVCRDHIDEFITVSNSDVSRAIRQLWEAKRLIPEPSGAMGVAGINNYAKIHADAMKGKKVLSIVCGANMDFSKLSLMASNSTNTAQKRRYYQITLPIHTGALLNVLDLHFKDLNVAEFLYGKIHKSEGWETITIAIDGTQEDFDKLENNLSNGNVKFSDISGETDIRYRIIRFDPTLFHDPIFMNVQFPERKGALRDFLRAISGVASICYFNYAYSGEVIGRGLMGFEFENSDDKAKFLEITKSTAVTCEELKPETVKRILAD